jgi:predicted nucleotide-binding protein (sugar kinase/HSP70/actin superfamily)
LGFCEDAAIGGGNGRKGKNTTILKIDDINNIGSTRLRIRSLIESLKFKNGLMNRVDNQTLTTPAFEKKDRKRKILVPWFADFYSPFFPEFFNLLGYNSENLPPSDQLSAEYGLKYSNNEICYPATLVVGDFMKALESREFNRNEIALGITQTGGQCRATNYISLLKKALISAGYNDIPVISISLGNGIINDQPGFKIKWNKVYKSVITCMFYADCLSQVYYATAPREIEPGAADKLKIKYLKLGVETLMQNQAEEFYNLAEKMVEEFERINNKKIIPRIGIVGEIFVKYNVFGHKNVVNWLITQGIEPIVPPITSFFMDSFANQDARLKGDVSHRSVPKIFMNIAEKFMNGIIKKMESKVNKFPFYHTFHNPHSDAEKASRIINLNSQFGEGWRIPAEFAQFAETGINNIISLQPFGCIANHIVSKGIEKRTRELYPSLNILSLDFDSGMSDVNIYNRLHFMVKYAKNDIGMNTLVQIYA